MTPVNTVAISKADFIGITADVISRKGTRNKIVGFVFIQIVNGTAVKAAVALPPRGFIVKVLAFFTAKYLVAFCALIARIQLKGHLTTCMADHWEPCQNQNYQTEEYSFHSKTLDHVVSLLLLCRFAGCFSSTCRAFPAVRICPSGELSGVRPSNQPQASPLGPAADNRSNGIAENLIYSTVA